MQDITIRNARREDIPFILALSHAGTAIPGNQPQPDPTDPCYAEAFEEIRADPNERLIVVEKAGEVVGTLQLSFLRSLTHRGALYGQLENVHIRTDQRGNGLGTQLIEWAVQACREKGCRRVQLTSNKVRADAHRFYERLGFDRTHEGFKLYL